MFFGTAILFAGCGKKNPLPDLRETYAATDTKPFGGKIAFSILQNSFPDNYVQSTKLAFEQGVLSYSDTAAVYFCLARNFYTKPAEADAILDYVYHGNSFFLSAANIDTILLHRIFCKVEAGQPVNQQGSYYENTGVKLIDDLDSSAHGYFYKPFSSYFSELNKNYYRTIGYNGNMQPNCTVFFWGKGKLFLHTDPRAFSNYFLLKNDNYLYMQRLLQLMPPEPEHVYWNDYYYRKNRRATESSFSTMDEILKYPSFSGAFWLALFLLIMYVLFGMKRRQRMIRQLQPNDNSSVIFAETIARLYLQKKDNKNIAEKMITYFSEYIRTNYFLYANAGSDDFIQALSRKSGVSLEKTISLYRAIDHANQAGKLDDYQLLSLNEQIQQFYKKRK